MKERYETPEMEIVEFETEDIITTSGNDDLPGMPISQFIVVYSVGLQCQVHMIQMISSG